jgi:hypothetical protein
MTETEVQLWCIAPGCNMVFDAHIQPACLAQRPDETIIFANPSVIRGRIKDLLEICKHHKDNQHSGVDHSSMIFVRGDMVIGQGEVHTSSITFQATTPYPKASLKIVYSHNA